MERIGPAAKLVFHDQSTISLVRINLRYRLLNAHSPIRVMERIGPAAKLVFHGQSTMQQLLEM